jgi:transcriptional regulator with XRE-family HTH domain
MTLKETTAELDRKIGETIRAFRISRGLSQEKLADALNVTFQQVQKYEKGTNRVSTSALILACRALGVSPIDILAGVVDDAPVDSTMVAALVAENRLMKSRLSRISTLLTDDVDEVSAALADATAAGLLPEGRIQ